MRDQAAEFGQAELTRAAEVINAGLVEMRGATSPRLLLELMCAQVLLPAAATGERAVMARLEALEHKLAAASRPRDRSSPATPRAGGRRRPPGRCRPAGRRRRAQADDEHRAARRQQPVPAPPAADARPSGRR